MNTMNVYLSGEIHTDWREQLIAFISELPKEFNLHDQIDRDKQFEKSFVDPIEMILECIDWQVDRSYGTRRTLEGLFG